MKNNVIRNIALSIGKNISDNDYGSISTIDKSEGNLYYVVKLTSDSYTLQYSNNIVNYVIKAD